MFARLRDRVERALGIVLLCGHAVGVRLGLWEPLMDERQWDDHRRRQHANDNE